MAVRASMAELITRVRLLINDPAGTGQALQDQSIQDVLDVHQTTVRYRRLRAQETVAPGGAVTYHDYYADVGDWEADEQLVDCSYNVLTPTASDRLTGHWTFTANQLPPVCISGKTYDVYAAAADLLEVWAAKLKTAYDFTADGASFSRSQQVAALLQLATDYRRRQRSVTALQVRGDIA